MVVGLGYSMGAIVLSNYVASYGADCALDGAMAISGGLDMRYQEKFYRAQRLWQPMLTEELRDNFLLGKWGYRVRQRLSHYEMLRTLRASHITGRSMTLLLSILSWLFLAVFSQNPREFHYVYRN